LLVKRNFDETMNYVTGVKPTVGAKCFNLLLHTEEEIKETRSIGLCFILHIFDPSRIQKFKFDVILTVYHR